jgi:hypothetical protein
MTPASASTAAPVVPRIGQALDVPGYSYRETDRCVFQYFDSIAALHAVAGAPDRSNMEGDTGWKDRAGRTGEDFKHTWYGRGITGGAAQAVAVIQSGQWEPGNREVQRLFDEIGADLPAPRMMKRRRAWSDQGDYLDIHRVYAGSLDRAWERRMPRETIGPKRITIAAAVSINAGVEADKCLWIGATALRLADLLTDSGYDVCIKGVRMSTEAVGTRALVQQWIAKPFSAPLDLSALVIGLAFAGTLRHFVYQAHMAIPHQHGYGLGSAASSLPVDTFDMNDTLFDGGPGVVIALQDVGSAEMAREWLTRTIEAINEGTALQEAD